MENIPLKILTSANDKSQHLRDMILRPEILVMAGAYDGLSARLFESMGFEAIQCSSGGIAAGLGYIDGELLTLQQTLHISQTIAESVSVPVNGDGERGYGSADQMGDIVAGYILAGCAGMNIEDSNPHLPGEPLTLSPVEQQLEKLEAIMTTKRHLGSHFFVNARPDSFLALKEDPAAALEEGIIRGNLYAEAGADCIFFLGVTSVDTIRTLVREIRAPVSILATAQTPPSSVLEALGVARVSYGTAFARAAAFALQHIADEIIRSGTIQALTGIMPGPEMANIMRQVRND